MPSRASTVWTIKELIEMIDDRRRNEFDANIGVSGKRGEGKSHLLFKIFIRMKGFRPWKHQVYRQEDVINLFKKQKFSHVFDDEAIGSGYKRDFQKAGQKELIKIITMYRDNFNIYASAIPFFYSLDKDLRELIFLHIHIIERGLAVLFLPLEDNIHQTDPWDTKNNLKLEEKWQKRKQEDPNFKFPYHKLSTFAGYLAFSDLTEKQAKLYKEIKSEKRKSAYLTEEELAKQKELGFIDRIYNQMKEGKLTKDGLFQVCLIEGKKLSSTKVSLNKKLQDEGSEKTLKYYLDPTHEEIKVEKTNKQIEEMIPVV